MSITLTILAYFIGVPLGLILWRLLISWGANININENFASTSKGVRE